MCYKTCFPWIFKGKHLKIFLCFLTSFWPPDAKSWLTGKDPDAGKDWGQEEKGTTEDEMVGWHHWLDGHGFGWTPGVGDGQGGLVCCGSWGRKESDMTKRLNWTIAKYLFSPSGFILFLIAYTRAIISNTDCLLESLWDLCSNCGGWCKQYASTSPFPLPFMRVLFNSPGVRLEHQNF